MQLGGPEEVCYDMRACCTPARQKLTPTAIKRRRRSSLRKHMRVETGLGKFEEAMHTLYGRSGKREMVVNSMKRDTVKLAKKVLATRPTFRNIMLAFKAVRTRPMITTGADAKCVVLAARSMWQMWLKVPTNRETHASMKDIALIYSAAVSSKCGGELQDLARLVNVDCSPIEDLVRLHRIPETAFGRFGVACRSMSKMWREVKTEVSTRKV